jgi:alpha-galactosidase/6-phospho-beta-glucosidase family protein
MKKVKLYEKGLIQGIVEGSKEGVIEALSLNPLIGSLDLARRLVEEFSLKQPPYWSFLK